MQYGLNVKTEPFEYEAGPFESYLEMEDEKYEPSCGYAAAIVDQLNILKLRFKQNRSKENRADMLSFVDGVIGVMRSGTGLEKCTSQDFKWSRDKLKKLRPGLPPDLTMKLNQLIYWMRKAGERASSELEWETEEEITSRVLSVKFRRDFNQFRLEVARAIGRWTVYRSDRGQRALKHVADNDSVLRDHHQDLLNSGVSDGASAAISADFIYAGQGPSRRVKQVRITGSIARTR